MLPLYLVCPFAYAQRAIVQDWQVPLGRRFRALKLWFVMRTYGGEGLRSYLRHHISLASNFAKRIERDPRFKLAAPPRFSLVCFTLAVRALSFLSQIVPPSKTFESQQKLSRLQARWQGRVQCSNCCWPIGLWLVRFVAYVKFCDLNQQVGRTGNPSVLLICSGMLSCLGLVTDNCSWHLMPSLTPNKFSTTQR